MVTELTLRNHCMLKEGLEIIIIVEIQMMNQRELGASQLIQIPEWSIVNATIFRRVSHIILLYLLYLLYYILYNVTM